MSKYRIKVVERYGKAPYYVCQERVWLLCFPVWSYIGDSEYKFGDLDTAKRYLVEYTKNKATKVSYIEVKLYNE